MKKVLNFIVGLIKNEKNKSELVKDVTNDFLFKSEDVMKLEKNELSEVLNKNGEIFLFDSIKKNDELLMEFLLKNGVSPFPQKNPAFITLVSSYFLNKEKYDDFMFTYLKYVPESVDFTHELKRSASIQFTNDNESFYLALSDTLNEVLLKVINFKRKEELKNKLLNNAPINDVYMIKQKV